MIFICDWFSLRPLCVVGCIGEMYKQLLPEPTVSILLHFEKVAHIINQRCLEYNLFRVWYDTNKVPTGFHALLDLSSGTLKQIYNEVKS